MKYWEEYSSMILTNVVEVRDFCAGGKKCVRTVLKFDSCYRIITFFFWRVRKIAKSDF